MLSGGGLTTLETAMPLPDPPGGMRPRGRRDLLPASIARQCGIGRRALLRHGRHHGEDLPDRQRPAADRARVRGRAGRTASAKASGLPLRIPVIEMVEIGAGGGSIARVDAMGRIAVGPESAGADPGPACYGRGGTAPDGDRCQPGARPLSMPARFAGGTMTLDAAAARRRAGRRGRRGSWA